MFLFNEPRVVYIHAQKCGASHQSCKASECVKTKTDKEEVVPLYYHIVHHHTRSRRHLRSSQSSLALLKNNEC